MKNSRKNFCIEGKPGSDILYVKPKGLSKWQRDQNRVRRQSRLTTYLFSYFRGDDVTATYMWRDSVQGIAAQRRWFIKNRPGCTLADVRVDPVYPMMRDIRSKGGETLERLRARCRATSCTFVEVLLECGHPDLWPTQS